MYNRTLSLFLTICTSTVSLGQAIPTYEMRIAAGGAYEYVATDPGTVSPQAGFRAYDNFRNITSLRGRVRMGGDEFADDLFMNTTGPALMNDLAWTISNTSTTQTLQQVTYTLRLYDESRIRQFEFANPVAIAIPPNSGIRLFTNSNIFTGFGAILTPHSFMSIQFSAAVGVDNADVGCTLYTPRTIGYSTQFAYNFTTGATLDFDGSDQTNIGFFVDTATIPSPGTAAILLTALPLSFRRRR